MTAAAPAGDGTGARCFVALLPAPASRRALQQCRDQLAPAIAGAVHGVRWVDAAAVHLTFRFLGASGSAQVEYLKHILPTLVPPFSTLATRRYAIWPNRARPRMLVLEMQPDPALLQLAADCEGHARKAGFDPEPRGFRAHLTLARLRPGCTPGSLPAPPATLGFAAVALLQSHPTQPGAGYRELARVALAGTD